MWVSSDGLEELLRVRRNRTTSSAKLTSFVSGIGSGKGGDVEKGGFNMLSESISDLRSVHMRWTNSESESD